MWDKILLNRSPFDRALADTNEITGTMTAAVTLDVSYIFVELTTLAQMNHTITLEAAPVLDCALTADLSALGNLEAEGALQLILQADAACAITLETEPDMECELSATLFAEGSADGFPHVEAYQAEVQMHATAALPGDLWIEVEGDAACHALGSVSGDLSVEVPLTAQLQAFGELFGNPAFADEEELTLAGVDLAPGGTLIIDTDTMEVIVNDRPAVDVMTADSQFVQLLPGNNELLLATDQGNAVLNLTVIYAGRWL